MTHFAGNKRSKGFTLVELLVVVLILAILMAVALPLYLSAIANSTVRTARANMQTIANAEQSYKLQQTPHAYTADITQLSDLPQGGIQGPEGRTYTVMLTGQCNPTPVKGGTAVDIPAGSFAVQSSVADDGCYIPGVSQE
jgi:type IV pilus assembly protein PilA